MPVDRVPVEEHLGLADYEEVVHLVEPVRNLRLQADAVRPLFDGRRLWMVNSTASGGGVAEMMPKMVSILRELGIDTEWAVIGTDRLPFFELTKRIHNLIHGAGETGFSDDDRKLYDDVSRTCGDALLENVEPDDVLVIHDPQPMGAGALVKRELDLPAIWRCHIGLDQILPATKSVWGFLEPYAEPYDHAVFSAPEYIPSYLAGRSSVVCPAIDPLSHKNRELTPHKLVGILCNSGLSPAHGPVLTPAFEPQAQRLLPDGNWTTAAHDGEIGLLYRPIVVQISRWDRLKGWAPLLDAFVRLKTEAKGRATTERHRRRLEITRLVLAGPDPESVADDPEGEEVLQELRRRYLELPAALQEDVVLLALPMRSRKENALMVNALQSCATVVVQNSIQEGFGLTVSEAMWKRRPVLASSACGIRQQIRDGVEGRLVEDPEDPAAIAAALDELLRDPVEREALGRAAQRRVHQDFLVFSQLSGWLRVLEDLLRHRAG